MTPSKAPIPLLGTWKMTKCETSRADLPHPTAGLTIFSQKEDTIQYTNDGVWSDGRVSRVSITLRMEGGWYPVVGSLMADSISFTALEGSVFEAKMRKAGVDAGTNRITISADGKTMTGRWELAVPGGGTVTWTTTAERQ